MRWLLVGANGEFLKDAPDLKFVTNNVLEKKKAICGTYPELLVVPKALDNE